MKNWPYEKSSFEINIDTSRFDNFSDFLEPVKNDRFTRGRWEFEFHEFKKPFYELIYISNGIVPFGHADNLATPFFWTEKFFWTKFGQKNILVQKKQGTKR